MTLPVPDTPPDWPPVDISALARRFTVVFPHLGARAGSLAVTLYRLLSLGAPVPWARLAAEAGRPEAEVRAIVANWPAVIEEPAGLVGFGGLSVRRVTAHVIAVAGRTLYTRCAWDTLFLPGVLGAPAEVASVCGVTGVPGRLRVEPARVVEAEPPGMRLSMVEPRADMRENLPQHF